MFHRGKLARRILVPLAAAAALIAIVGVGSASRADNSTYRAASLDRSVHSAGGIPARVDGAVTTTIAATTPVAADTTDGTQLATPGNPTDDDVFSNQECNNGPEVGACFQRSGDRIWVWDGGDNGLVVRAHWSNWLWDGSSWVLYRNGDCKISWKGWGYCDKDFYEDSSANADGSTGSGVRVYACNWDCTNGYKWARNNK